MISERVCTTLKVALDIACVRSISSSQFRAVQIVAKVPCTLQPVPVEILTTGYNRVNGGKAFVSSA